MKTLLLGAGGRLGQCLAQALPQAITPPRQALDLAQPACVLRAQWQALGGGAVVNAAAVTAVDAAETAMGQEAWAVNAAAWGVLGGCAREGGWPVLHFSTEQVFDGSSLQPYREADPPAPANAYGRSKLAGEAALAASGCRALVVRTSWLFAAHGPSFVRSIWQAAQREGELRVVDDQFGAPTSAHWLAGASLQAWRQGRGHGPALQLLHLNAAGRVSRADLAGFILQEMRALGLTVRAALRPVPTSAFPLPARRPANGCLDTSLAASAFGLVAPPWEEGVRDVLAKWRAP